jgi:hypothetical protein
MSVIPFPARGPFSVHIIRDGHAWLVVFRDHGWLHNNLFDAVNDACEMAEGFGVDVRVAA